MDGNIDTVREAMRTVEGIVLATSAIAHAEARL